MLALLYCYNYFSLSWSLLHFIVVIALILRKKKNYCKKMFDYIYVIVCTILQYIFLQYIFFLNVLCILHRNAVVWQSKDSKIINWISKCIKWKRWWSWCTQPKFVLERKLKNNTNTNTKSKYLLNIKGKKTVQ